MNQYKIKLSANRVADSDVLSLYNDRFTACNHTIYATSKNECWTRLKEMNLISPYLSYDITEIDDGGVY